MPKEYLEWVSAYLGTRHIELGYRLFDGLPEYDSEGMWDVPEAVELKVTFNNVIFLAELALGWVGVGTFKGKPIVLEQNASPLIVYYPAEQ